MQRHALSLALAATLFLLLSSCGNRHVPTAHDDPEPEKLLDLKGMTEKSDFHEDEKIELTLRTNKTWAEKGMSKDALAKAHKWVNLGDPSLVIRLKKADKHYVIDDVFIPADGWGDKSPMKVLAQKQIGKTVTRKTLDALSKDMLKELEAHFGDKK